MGVKLGDLEILDMVATGGMAEVYRARINDRLYAVKKILPQFTREKDLVQMFMDEARVAQLLKHPNIVTVFDLCLSDVGEMFIAMEYADGRDLADVLYAASIKGLREWSLARLATAMVWLTILVVATVFGMRRAVWLLAAYLGGHLFVTLEIPRTLETAQGI